MNAVDDAAQRRERLRRQLQVSAHWLDELVRIPGTRWTVGLDAVIGLVPFVGDLLGLLLGGWLVWAARQGGVPETVQRAMLRNLAIETVVGFVPVLGDVFDVAWRANVRNRELVEDWLRSHELPPPKPKSHRARWLVAGLLLALLLWFWSPWAGA
ncbi:MAG: DUF4112 domain-containing protein [Oceanococcaceae bacterium]